MPPFDYSAPAELFLAKPMKGSRTKYRRFATAAEAIRYAVEDLRTPRAFGASSRASGGFTTIVRSNSSPARSFMPLTRIRWINRCPDRPERCRQTGKRCFTNRGRLF